jgi:hypothetical protein
VERAVEPLLRAIAATDDLGHRWFLGSSLTALSVVLTDAQAAAAMEPMLEAIATQWTTYVLTESAQRLATLANSSLAEDVALQIIVDAMKTPWMAGQPTTILLEAIGERFDFAPKPTDGASYWDVIEWIAASHPEIDLVTPPENPYAN